MSKSGAQVIDDDVLKAIDGNEDNQVDSFKANDENVRKSASVDDSELETLRSELERQRRESEKWKSEAEDNRRRYDDTSTKLNNETNNRISAEEVAISNALAASAAEAERLENEIVAAQEAGKFHEAAKLTRQLASQQVKIDSWEQRKSQFEAFKEQQKTQVNQAVQTANNSRSKAWIDAHPEFNTDMRFRNKVLAAHYSAQSEGLVIDSEEYISYIDNAVSNKRQETDTSLVQQKQRSYDSTPPSREVRTNSRRDDSGSRKLRPEEAELAALTFPDLKPADAQQKFYESKMELIKQGKLSGER